MQHDSQKPATARTPQENIHVFDNGDGNSISIGRPAAANHVAITLCGNATVEIGDNCILGNLTIYATPGSRVVIGSRVGFNGITRLLLHEPHLISIGDDCLFSSDIDVTVSDMHSILDNETGLRINPARDIVIGNRVWIGQRSIILKGAVIGQDTAIGAASVVSGPIPANCIAAGVPARILRVGTRWDRRLL